jgi:ankyrin repeat protein
MTFEDCHRVIKKGNLLELHRAIDAGELDPNLSNRFSWTLLMLAALEGNTRIADLLLERGAAVNAKNDFGETALSLAAHKGHEPLLRLLVKHGASPDPRPHGSGLRTWLEGASGLPPAKIGAIMDLIENERRKRESGS